MNNIRVQMVTTDGMVVILEAASFWAAIHDAEEAGYKILSAVQLGSV